jgi:hypothetical protein
MVGGRSSTHLSVMLSGYRALRISAGRAASESKHSIAARSECVPPNRRTWGTPDWGTVRASDARPAHVDQNGLVLANHPEVEEEDLSAWCRLHLGSEISKVLFCTGHLSTVVGVELTSSRRVVVKLRAGTPAPWLRRGPSTGL